MKQVVPATPRALRHVESRGVPKLSEVEGRFRPPFGGLRFWTVLRACTGHGDPYRVKAWLDRAKAYNLEVELLPTRPAVGPCCYAVGDWCYGSMVGSTKLRMCYGTDPFGIPMLQ